MLRQTQGVEGSVATPIAINPIEITCLKGKNILPLLRDFFGFEAF